VRTSLTFDRTKQRALPVWLPIVVVLLIVARIVSSRYDVKSDVDLVHWTDGERARALAIRLHRPILYEFSAEWCGPCHALEREIFMDPDLAADINNRYIAVKVIDRQREAATAAAYKCSWTGTGSMRFQPWLSPGGTGVPSTASWVMPAATALRSSSTACADAA
jgi:thiol-disulfide isomerase/thioredoxin